MNSYCRKNWIIVICCFLFYGCSGTAEKDTIIKLKTLEGDKIDLEAYEGKTIFLNFWATWCAPCIKEMPSIASAQEKLKDSPVVFLLASNEDPKKIEAFSKRKDLNLNYVLLDMSFEELSIYSLPTTFIIDKKGKVIFKEAGIREWDSSDNISFIKNKIDP